MSSTVSAQAQWERNGGVWGQSWPNFNKSKADTPEVRKEKRAERRARDVELDRAFQSTQTLLSEDTAYAMSRAVHRYQRIVAQGGWKKIPKIKGRWLREGVSDDRVMSLRQRLVTTGDMQPHRTNAPNTFDKGVTAGLKRFQVRHGIRPKGVVDNRTLRALNVSAQVRLGQLRLNQQRLRDLLDH
ncbi:MAG: peptidoglycan-binding protein, partial [Pseudomonadota bacterium]